jgi:hypothetical protein
MHRALSKNKEQSKQEERRMSIPKTERMTLGTRTEAERVAITLEYLSSFVVWTENLDEDELKLLSHKIENLVHPTNTQNLNQFLEGCTRYITEEREE